MTDDTLFDDPYDLEATDLTCGGYRVQRIPARKAGAGCPIMPSTAETRARYAFVRTKRLGDTWQEGRFLYRMGPNGVTVFDIISWEGYSQAIPSQPSQSEGLLDKILERKWRPHHRIPLAQKAYTEQCIENCV